MWSMGTNLSGSKKGGLDPVKKSIKQGVSNFIICQRTPSKLETRNSISIFNSILHSQIPFCDLTSPALISYSIFFDSV